MAVLEGRRLLLLVADDYEDLELWYPRLRMLEAGAEVIVAGPDRKATYRGKHGYPCVSDLAVSQVDIINFDGLIIPGGWMPDKLRRDVRVLRLVQHCNVNAKLIAAICHGGWIPISAGVYKGVRATGSLGIKDDLINAGVQWEDAPAVVDRHFVSSRKPDDLPDFCRAILHVLTAKASQPAISSTH